MDYSLYWKWRPIGILQDSAPECDEEVDPCGTDVACGHHKVHCGDLASRKTLAFSSNLGSMLQLLDKVMLSLMVPQIRCRGVAHEEFPQDTGCFPALIYNQH